MKRYANKGLLPVTAALISLLLLLQWGCGESEKKAPLVLAATSDLEETGILQEWVRDFGSRHGIEVELKTAMDEEVLGMAEHGECDLLITHLPTREQQLEQMNYVINRCELMRDDYVIVGPPRDPARVKEAQTPTDAMKSIAQARAPYVLRAGYTGTALKELELWRRSGVEDFGDWLLKSGEGAGEVLRQASRRGAYTLTDRSTYESMAGELDLEVLLQEGEDMGNVYHVMGVSGLAYPDTNLEDAAKMIDYLTSEDAQRFFYLGAWEPPGG